MSMSNRQSVQQSGQQLMAMVDRGTTEQLLSFLQAFHRQPFVNLNDVLAYQGVIDDQIDFIDWTGTRYHITPLIVAAGKGSYEKTKILLVHGADPNKQCATGDTALNLAAHRQKYSIVDLLLQYRANPNYYNQSGKTALHRAAASYNHNGLKHLRALLNAGADPTIEDRNQRLPLDDAVLANRPEIVDALLSHNRALIQRAYRAAIISSRLGYDGCLIALLNHGMDPNITDRTCITPLHVAVRSSNLSTVRVLIAHGADQNLANHRGETSLSIAKRMPPEQQQAFVSVLSEAPQTIPSKLCRRSLEDNHVDSYPPLRNHRNWTLDNDLYRSRTAIDSSVEHLLDTVSESFWCCTQSTNAWVIFDLKHQHRISGVKLVGCGHYSAPQHVHVDVSNAITGPWLQVKEYTCPFARDQHEIFFPSLETRFVRIFIVNNHGGDNIQIQSVLFFGVDMRLVCLLRERRLENSLNTLLANGINDQEALYENRDAILHSPGRYLHFNDQLQCAHLTASLKPPQLTFLHWFVPPQTTAIAGIAMETFSVEGDDGVTDRVKLEEKPEGSPYPRTIALKDLEPTHHRSLVDFSDYTISSPGRYLVRVVSADHPQIHTSWQLIVVAGSTLSQSPTLSAAADEYSQQTSTFRLVHPSASDKDTTLFFAYGPPTTTTDDISENRAFVAKIYESEESDTDDDTYLTVLQVIDDSPYYFHTTNMPRTDGEQRAVTPQRITGRGHYDPRPTSRSTHYRPESSDDRNYGRPAHDSKSRKQDDAAGSSENTRPYRSARNRDTQERTENGRPDRTSERTIIPTKYQDREERLKKLKPNRTSSYSKRQRNSSNSSQSSSSERETTKTKSKDQKENHEVRSTYAPSPTGQYTIHVGNIELRNVSLGDDPNNKDHKNRRVEVVFKATLDEGLGNKSANQSNGKGGNQNQNASQSNSQNSSSRSSNNAGSNETTTADRQMYRFPPENSQPTRDGNALDEPQCYAIEHSRHNPPDGNQNPGQSPSQTSPSVTQKNPTAVPSGSGNPQTTPEGSSSGNHNSSTSV